ncbi:MAG: ArsR/SmtB family transcription factor [Acidobacteriota bacterium]
MSDLARQVDRHKALGHPARLRILAMLREGPLCACQITAVLGLAASTVSAHLAELRRAGLVEEEKDGRWVEFRLAADAETERQLATLWPVLERDAAIAADAALTRRLRRVELEVLCRADLDLVKLGLRRKDAPGRRPRRSEAG